MVAPDLGEQTLAAQHFAGMENELVQEPELTVGEVGDERPDPGLPAREVEDERTRAQHASLRRGQTGVPKLSADPCDQLVECEGLGEVVARAELESA